MKIEEKLDSGPILNSQKFNLPQSKTHGEIEEEFSVVGADLLIKSLKLIENGKAIFTNQINSEATYAKKNK